MVKHSLIFLCAIIFAHNIAMAQDTIIPLPEMAWSYESMPSFDHDFKQDKLLNFVKDNLKQFDTLENEAIVYVQFKVDTLGFTSQHKILKGVNEQLDNEALRICKLIKFDHPAKKRGEPACITFTLPIKFEPQSSNVPKNKKLCRCRKCCFKKKLHYIVRNK